MPSRYTQSKKRENLEKKDKENKQAKGKDFKSTHAKSTQTFKSKFHESMQVMFKKELDNRRSSRVTLKQEGTKNKFYAVNANGARVNLNGHYAYVTKLNGEIVAWPKANTGHNDTCHFALSDFAQQVAYAGEVIFSQYKVNKPDYAHCDEHNNASGTYKPDAKHDSQSGLPLETFKLPNFAY